MDNAKDHKDKTCAKHFNKLLEEFQDLEIRSENFIKKLKSTIVGLSIYAIIITSVLFVVGGTYEASKPGTVNYSLIHQNNT